MYHPSDEINSWIEQWPAAQQEQVRWLADRVRAADPRIAEAIKWRRLTFTVDDNWHHWLCAIGVSKQGLSLIFHKGALLDDPDNVLDGDGRYLRKMPLDVAVANPKAVAACVRQAIAHQTELLASGE